MHFMKTVFTLTQETNGTISGHVQFDDGKELDLWPGRNAEVLSQIHAAIRIASGKHTPYRPGTSFHDWGQALLKKSCELGEPRYCIDRLLREESNPIWALVSRLMFFPIERLHYEERILLAGDSFNTHMMSGLSWFLDNDHIIWLADARKALKKMKAMPYLKLLEDIIARLAFRGIIVGDPKTHSKWSSISDSLARGFEKKCSEIDRHWWDLWRSKSLSFERYAMDYIAENITVFRSRDGGAGGTWVA